MNLQPYNLNYQDGLNTYPIIDYINDQIGIGGGGTGGGINSYVYLYQSSNLMIANNTSNSGIYFRVYNSPNATNGNYAYSVKIDKDGKLYVYHLYDLLNPTMGAGWYDVEKEMANAIFNTIQTNIQFLAIEGEIVVLAGNIATNQTNFNNFKNLTNASLIKVSDSLEVIGNSFQALTTEATTDAIYRASGSISAYVNNSRALFSAQRSFIDQMRIGLGNVANVVTNPFLVAGVGISASIFGMILGNNSFNYNDRFDTNSNGDFTLDETTRTEVRTSNYSNILQFTSNFITDMSNVNITFGFINSNILTKQVVPYLRTNKIEIGNITTPNAAYQLEMTGDLNTNMLWINSTSLTSLLNQKQNNMSATQPIFITTANIGLNYDSSLTKVGNNLSVVKTATAPLNWTGNDIALSYDNTLINNAGSLGVSIATESKWSFTGGNIYNKAKTNVGIGTDSGLTYKLNVIGDTYISSNTHIGGISKLSFISAYSGQSAFGLATGTNEYYIEFNSGGGTLILNEPCACDILCVGAGGNGGIGASSGGGGAGEVIYYPNFPLRAGTLNIQVGGSSTNTTNRISRIYPSSGNEIMRATGGGNGGTSIFYSTSGGSVSALTAISGTADAYISITAGTTLTLNASCSADIFMIGGGGGGGKTHAGGGGAGAYYYGTNLNFNSGTYTITIGAGGTGGTNFSDNGTNGGNTSIASGGTNLYLVNGGGKGGGSDGTGGSGTTSRSGKNGGCGGGGGSYNGGSTPTNTAIPAGSASNSGTNGTGNNGGTGCANQSGGVLSGGGGGGANSAGGNAPDSQTGNGGNGGDAVLTTITGTQQAFGGGGGGGVWGNAYSTTGGLGGGANVNGVFTRVGGQGGTTGAGSNAVANTGSGGGGGGPFDGNGGNGSAGIVIIRFKNYLSIGLPTSGGSGGGGGKSQTGAIAGTKFDEYKSYVLAGLNGTSTTGGNGGSGSSLYNTRFTTTITGSSLSVGLGGTGMGASPTTPVTKTNYGDGGDGNGGVGYGGIVIIRFKADNSYLQIKAIKDNANSGLILNANEVVSGTTTPYQLRIFPWSDTYTSTGVATRGWTFRTCDGITNNDLINLFSYFGGRVGIKTKNPGAVLDVNGDIQCKTFNIIGNEQYGVNCQIVNQNATGEASFGMYAGQGTSYGGLALYYLPTDNLGYISCSKSFKIKTGNDAANSYIYIDNTYGYIGVGKTDPVSKLDVNGTLTTNYLSATIIYAGEVQSSIINNLNGNLVNNNNLFTSNLYINNAIDCQNHPINNCSYLYGGCSWTNELKAYTNYYHKDDQGRDRIYFKNDTTNNPPNHFTLFKSGGTTHAFSDKDDVQYCLLERFGLTTYFEVISGGGYDNVGVLDGVNTGTYVFRKMYLRLSTFTEVHRCFCEDELFNNYDDFINEFIGRIVVSKGKIKTALKEADKDWEILEGKDGIKIDDSHPVIELSRKKKDKAVVGIITKRNQNADMPNRLVINSLGETACWVINTGGNIENGDLITTSDELGYGEKQDCDFIKNYTIGKCMIDCSFELDNPNYKCEVIDETRDLKRAFLPIFIYSG